MKGKIFALLLILTIMPFSMALGDRWDLIFSDGTTTINGTDVCLNSGICLSTAGAAGSGDITAVNTAGPYLYGGVTIGAADLYLNETYLNSTIDSRAGGGGNSSWNESHADTLYYGINNPYSYYNSTTIPTYVETETDPLWTANFTVYNSSWSEDTNTLYYAGAGLDLNASDFFSILASYAMPQGCNNGEIAEYNTTSGGWDCAIDDSAGSGMSNWILAASGIGGSESITEGETVTFGSDDNYIEVSRSTNNIGYSINETYLNNTIDARAGGDNSSWNETYARTIFYDSEADLTALLNDNYADISVTGDNSSWNKTYADSLYLPHTVDQDIIDDNLYNSSQFTEDSGQLNILQSWLTSFINSWFSGKTTDDLSQGSTNKYDNSSWNESHADSKYLQSYSETDPLWNGNYTNVAFTNVEETFSENIIASKNISQGDNDYHCFGDSCDAYMYFNGTTLIMKVN